MDPRQLKHLFAFAVVVKLKWHDNLRKPCRIVVVHLYNSCLRWQEELFDGSCFLILIIPDAFFLINLIFQGRLNVVI